MSGCCYSFSFRYIKRILSNFVKHYYLSKDAWVVLVINLTILGKLQLPEYLLNR